MDLQAGSGTHPQRPEEAEMARVPPMTEVFRIKCLLFIFFVTNKQSLLRIPVAQTNLYSLISGIDKAFKPLYIA